MKLELVKTLVGRVESVTLGLHDLSGHVNRLPMRARIDTGASTSSLHARDISLFQRDGKTFARFLVDFGGWWLESEAPIVREGIVKSSQGKQESRLFIRCAVQAGGRDLRVHFSLSDRSRMVYPALLGRNFLNKGYLVDVSQKYLLGLPVPALGNYSSLEHSQL